MSNYYCRLCFINCNPEDSSLFSKQITEMIEYCIPEFDLKLVNNPIICGSCHNSLKLTEKFKRTCLNIQENIKKMMAENKIVSPNLEFTVCNMVNVSASSRTESFEDIETSITINSAHDVCGDAEVSAIMNESNPTKAPEGNDIDDADILDLLESSSNITKLPITGLPEDIPKLKTTLRRQSNGLFSNFYDDSFETTVHTNSIQFDEKKMSRGPKKKKIKTETVEVTDPLDVKTQQNYCITCSLMFSDILDLISHLYSDHNSNELFNCLLCRYKGPSLPSVKNHFRLVHGHCVDIQSTCLFCLTTTTTNFKELFEHMRKDHKKHCLSNKFRCPSCDFSTRSYGTYRKHFFRSHDCICNFCLRSYDSIEELKRHIGHHSAIFKRNQVPKISM